MRSSRCARDWARSPKPIVRPRCSTTTRSTARCPQRVRTVVLTLDAERAVVAARVAGLDDVDIVGAEDVPDVADSPVLPGRPEQQLAMLAVRLEMAATYLRLVQG